MLRRSRSFLACLACLWGNYACAGKGDPSPTPNVVGGSGTAAGAAGANSAGGATGGSGLPSNGGSSGATAEGGGSGTQAAGTNGGFGASGGASNGGASGAGLGGAELGGAGSGGAGSGGAGSGGAGSGGAPAGAAGSGGAPAGAGGAAGGATGPIVDRTNPRLYELQFTAKDADPEATRVLGKQFAYLDTRVTPRGKLVIYLHGAGDFSNCGNGALGTLVASWGFHWLGPCYLSNYGVENCGSNIEGCRLEAFEGTDHHAFLDIKPPDSIETRIVRGLTRLQTLNPQGDWQYFLDGGAPRWSDIVITGHSHGASSSGVIGMHRSVFRVVMLAGPYDPGQAWLSGTSLTSRDRFFGFTHSADSQHSGHLAAFDALGLPGMPTRVDGAAAPYGGSHRLYSSANVGDAHGSVTSGNIAEFVDVWRYLYGADN